MPVQSYRREIDGLRFIAVASVILYHAGVPMLAGGYLGVDVFFVISGFLITSILLRDMAEEKFSIFKFYERRFRRILPALFLITTLTAIPAAYLLLPSQLTEFGYSLIGTATFVSNLVFAREVDYFTNGTDLKPLIHTWSLAVEEQFYIFFPPLLFALFRFGARRIATVLCAIAAASLLAAQLGAIWYPEQNFFLTHGRIWELAAGSLAGLVSFYRPQPARSWLALAGLLLVIAPMFLYGSEIGSPTLFTAVPVAGAALVLLYGQASTFVGRLLSFGPFVLIGLVSYSAYLWHQPIFAYARIYFHGEAPPLLMAALVALTFGLSYLTWKFIETPPRQVRTGLLSRKWVFIWAGASIAITVAIGLAFATQTIRSQVRTDELIIDPVVEWEAAKSLYINNPAHRSDLTAFSHEDRINALIFGDSHSVGTLNMLKMLEENGGLAEYEFVRQTMPENCLLTSGGAGNGDVVSQCMDALASGELAQLFASADLVLFSLRWSAREYLIQFIPDLIEWNRDHGIKTVVLSNMPEWTEGAPVVIRRLLAESGDASLSAAFFNTQFQSYRNLPLNAMNAALRAIVESNGGLYLDKQDYACDDGFCFAVSEKMQALHTDYGHETVNGAAFYAGRIAQSGWFDGVADFLASNFPPVRATEETNARHVQEALSVLGVTAGKALQGTDGDDLLTGTDGNDTLNGMDGNDVLEGLEGDDFLNGGRGNDVLRAGSGNNRLYGDRGDDVIYPGSGTTVLKGGPGADLLVVTFRSGILSVQDFVPGEDRIDLSAIATQRELDAMLAAKVVTDKGYITLSLRHDLKILLKKNNAKTADELFLPIAP